MNQRWNRRAVLALVLVAIWWRRRQLGRVAGAQEATGPAGAQPGDACSRGADLARAGQQRQPRRRELELQHLLPRRPAGPPRGHHRLHPGAESPGVPHRPDPDAWRHDADATGVLPGLLGGFRQPDPTRPGGWQSPFFGIVDPRIPCGRAGQDPCLYAACHRTPLDLGSTPASSSTRRRAAAKATPRSRHAGSRRCFPAPTTSLSDVDGPTMSGRIDVVAPDQPVQTASERWRLPPSASTRRIWPGSPASIGSAIPPRHRTRTARRPGRSPPASAARTNPWLSINEFAPAQMVIIAGDTVTWTNQSPGAVAHTVSGFASHPRRHPAEPESVPAGLHDEQRRAATAARRKLPT